MIHGIYAVLAWAALVQAKYQAVYTPDLSKGYIQAENGTLYQLTVNSDQIGVGSVSKQISVLASPPTNSSLVVDNNSTLYAISGSQGCGTAPIVISSYNASQNSWNVLAKSSNNWYQSESTAWFDHTKSSFYFYGGVCNGTITNDFYLYNTTSNSFSVASASPMPREMAYAQAISLDGSSTLMIGGQANSGWLSMQQLAFWEYGSWTYRTVSGSQGIDSRNSPLLLPIWSSPDKGESSSTSTIEKVLVVGGTVDGRDSEPSVVALSFNSSQGWAWEEPTLNATSGELIATLYETVLVFSNSNQNPSLYDSNNNWAGVSLVAVPQSTGLISGGSDRKSLPTASIAAISTIIPLVFILVAIGGIWMWWRKRQQRITFQPRQSQIMSPSILSISGDNWEKPPPPRFDTHERPGVPFQNPFDDEHDINEQSDIQIVVHKRQHALRIMNPDESDFSDSENHDAYTVDASNHPHQRTISGMSNVSRRSTSSRKQSGSSRKPSGQQDFDFTS